MKKIGILGSGIVAQTLGAGFLKHGYHVMMGTRDISKLGEWKSTQSGILDLGSFEETASYGEIIVLAVKGTVAKTVLEQAGKANLEGKTIIDATNPISDAPPQDGVLQYFTTPDKSLMEILQDTVPNAHFVKAFNSVGNAYMVDPDFESKPTMFICGNDTNAKAETTEILTAFGWETADFGVATAARAIEQLCILWCLPGFVNGEWSHAFKMLKK